MIPKPITIAEIILLIAVLGAGGWWIAKKEVRVARETPAPIATKSPVGEWTTHTDSELNVRFDYPLSWGTVSSSYYIEGKTSKGNFAKSKYLSFTSNESIGVMAVSKGVNDDMELGIPTYEGDLTNAELKKLCPQSNYIISGDGYTSGAFGGVYVCYSHKLPHNESSYESLEIGTLPEGDDSLNFIQSAILNLHYGGYVSLSVYQDFPELQRSTQLERIIQQANKSFDVAILPIESRNKISDFKRFIDSLDTNPYATR